MKKVLSFVLVLAMVLGSVSMVFAFSDVESGADHEEAINVLSSLGVVSGYTDGTFKPEKVVTRAEMAAFLINALFGEDKQITQRATKFSDVTAAHWASGFVDYANTLDIIAGYTDGTFKPDQPVTYNEAITMVVKALGYRDACLNGTYPASYVNQAKALGLLDEVDGLGTVGAVRGDIAQLVYNALNCPIGTVNKDGEWIANKGKQNENGTFAADTMLARLGGYEDPTAVVITDTDVDNAVIDIAEYLGAYVNVVRDEKGGDIIGIYEIKSEFITGEFDTLKTKFEGYTVDQFAYGTAKNAPVEFVNGVKLASGSAITYNTDDTYTLAVKISGKHITNVYSVQLWESETPFQITETQVKNITKNNKLGAYAFTLDKNDEIDTDSFVLEGVDTLADIAEDNIITVFLSDGKIVKVQVGTEVVTGKVTKISGTKVTVAGTAYEAKYALTKEEIAALSFSSEYALYLDFDGTVRVIEDASEDPTTGYGVLIDAATSGKTWNSDTTGRQLKIFTAEGKEEIFTVYAKAAAPLNYTDSTTFMSTWQNAVVEYTLNDDGEVKTIEEVATDNPFSAVTAKTTVDGKYFADDAVIFKISGTSLENYKYEVVKASSLAGKTGLVGYYDVDADTSKICVAQIGGSSATAAEFGIYLKEEKVGTDKFEVTFYVDGVEKVYETTETSGLTKDRTFVMINAASNKVTITKMADMSTPDIYIDGTENYVITTSASIKSNTLMLDGNDVAIDAEAQIYVYDEAEGTFTVGSIADLENLEKGDKVSVYDYDADADLDEVAEVVVIWFVK